MQDESIGKQGEFVDRYQGKPIVGKITARLKNKKDIEYFRIQDQDNRVRSIPCDQVKIFPA
jgi:hypothetical protein